MLGKVKSFSTSFVLVLSFIMASMFVVQAADCYWQGGGADTSWFNAANWRNAQVPSSSADIAYFVADTPTAVTIDQNLEIKTIYLRNAGMQITIETGANLSFKNSGDLVLQAEEDALIDGAGTITYSDAGGVDYANNKVLTGKTLKIAAKITGNGFEFNGGGGTIWLANPDNDFTAMPNFSDIGVVRVDSFSNAGESSPLGKAESIYFAHRTILEYTGGSTETDRALLLNTGNGIDPVIRHNGSGTLKFTGEVKSNTGNYHAFVFEVAAQAAVEITGRIHNDNQGELWLKKTGAGTLSLSNTANSWLGETTLEEGTLQIETLQAYSGASTLNLTGGRFVLNEANDMTLAKVKVKEGNSQLALASGLTGVTLTLGNLEYLGGAVDFDAPDLGSSNKILINNFDAGLLGSWCSVANASARANYDTTSGVGVYIFEQQSLTALGPSMIQDLPNKSAVIDATGTGGGITLATNPTRVAELMQATATDALVTLDGYALIAPYISLRAGAGDLTLGAGYDDGMLQSTETPAVLHLDNQDTDGAKLTLQAAIAQADGQTLQVLKSGTGDVALVGPLAYTGTTTINEGNLIIKVPANKVHGTSLGAITGAGNLVKEGTGTLEWPNIANTYRGTTTIKEGVVSILNSAAFGNTAGPTIVQDGGAIDFIGTGDNNLILGDEHIFAEGAGYDGLGAIRNTGTRSQYNAISLLTLTDDLTLLTNGRLDVRANGNSKHLDFNGHGITKRGSDTFGLTSIDALNDQGTAYIDTEEGTFTMEASTTLSGGSDNKVYIRDGARFDFFNLNQGPNWSLQLDQGSEVNVRQGTGYALNNWLGPITLGGSVTFLGSDFTSDHYPNTISGSGKLVKYGNTHNTTYLTGNANDWSGGTRVRRGALYASNPGAIPSLANIELVEEGALILRVQDTAANEPGFAPSSIYDLAQNVSIFQSSTTSLGLDTFYEDLDFSAPWPANGIRKLGPYKLSLLDDSVNVAGIYVYDGTLDLSAVSSDRGADNIIVGYDKNTDKVPATLITGGDNVYTAVDRGYGVSGQPKVVVGERGRGVLYINDNAHLAGRLVVGDWADGSGAVWQSGGVMHNTGGGANDGLVGNQGYGYYNLSGGICTNNGYTQLGHTPAGIGILEMTGGTFTFSSVYAGSMGISRGGVGIAHITGGTFHTANTLWLGDESDNDATDGTAIMNVTEQGEVYIDGPIDMGNRDDMVSMLNLKGGVTTTKRIYRHDRSNTQAFVNFNGGTLRLLNPDSGVVFGYDRYVDVVVHDGGAIFDIAQVDKALAINTPLHAPENLALVSIPIISGGADYLGAPYVKLDDTPAHGAVAYAHLEHGSVTSIEIVSPGSFRAVPTVELKGGSPRTAAVLGTPVMALHGRTGGLIKKGPGTLLLNSANTYGGATEVQEGLLKIQNAKALVPHKTLVISGGTLDLGGVTLTPESVNFTEGRLINGTLNTHLLEKTGPGELALGTKLIYDNIAIPEALQPGLFEGMVRSNWDKTTPNPQTGLQLTPRAAIGTKTSNSTYAGGMWAGNNHTWMYTGYVWNRSATNEVWTFRARFDDNWGLWLNGALIREGGDSLNIFNVTLTPGPHLIEMRFGDGFGDAGPTDEPFGLAYDPWGRESQERTDYQQLLDPGDGSLFTVDLPENRSAPGLLESFINEAWNTEDDGHALMPQLTTRAGNGAVGGRDTYAGGLWRGGDYTWIYKGVIWNRSASDVTWNWRLNFDDYVLLKIDDTEVAYANHGPVYKEYTLTPGPHTIEIRFGDQGGQVGPASGLGGLTYDPYNVPNTPLGNFVLLADPGDGSLLTTDLAYGESFGGSEVVLPPTINVREGTLRLLRETREAGLFEGVVEGSFNKAAVNPATAIELTTTAANGSCYENGTINGKYWANDTTYIYSGFLWNREDHDVTWTFAKNFDDTVWLTIGGITYIDDGVWNNAMKVNVTLTPGAHSFEVRFGQSGGGAGLPGGDDGRWMAGGPGAFLVDKQGRNEEILANYEILVDPGDGSVFSTSATYSQEGTGLFEDTHIHLAPEATLDLDGNEHKIAVITGSGTIANGSLADGGVYQLKFVDGEIEPLNLVVVDISHWIFVPADEASINPGGVSYVVASGNFTGKPTLSGFDSNYKLIVRNHELKMIKTHGTILILR